MSATNDFLRQTVYQQHFPPEVGTDYGDAFEPFVYQMCRPYIVCEDGFKFSVQASAAHYCSPRENFRFWYESVEIGFPNRKEPILKEYAEDPKRLTKTVYGWVPVSVVDAVIEKHGGIKGWKWHGA